nr:PUR alpha protein [Hymenolepis microstoma]
MSDTIEKARKDIQDSEKELISKTINVQNRRYYLDVKENAQGRFIKITESSVSGQKARVFMSAAAAKEFIDKLDQAQLVLSTLPEHDPKNLAPEGLLKSFTIVKDSRRYFLDVKENERMRFLRVSMLSNGSRANVIIPCEGIKSIQETVRGMLTDFFSDFELSSTPEKSKVLQSGNMIIYFDLGSNRNGVFLRISELSGSMRNSIVIREQDFIRFSEIFNEVIESRSATEDKVSSPAMTEGEKKEEVEPSETVDAEVK